MKNKPLLFLVVLIILINLISFSSAWIVPDTHKFIADESLLIAPNSPVAQVISPNYDDFLMGMFLTDYSVFLYFNQGFSTIGTVYLANHNNLICPRAVELAVGEKQLSVAYGICSMEFMDSPSHNGLIPLLIQRTGLVNGIIHAPIEECINKKVANKQLHTEGINAIVNTYQEHRDFLIKVFQSDNRASKIDVGLMMDAFVAEIAQNDQYTVGFRGFTAIPTSIHIIVLLWFTFGLVGLAYLIRQKNKSLFNKISIMILLFFFVLPVILAYSLYFTGNIWKAFQVITTPLCPFMPISGYETFLDQAIQNEVNLFTNGANAVYQIPDPSGLQALHSADQGNVWKLWVIGIILGILIFIFIKLNLRKKNNIGGMKP